MNSYVRSFDTYEEAAAAFDAERDSLLSVGYGFYPAPAPTSERHPYVFQMEATGQWLFRYSRGSSCD